MITQMRPSQFAQWLTEQPDAMPLLLDVREPWEIGVAQVAALPQSGSFDLLSMPMQSIPQRLNELPLDRPIALLCHHGVRSQHVALFLQQRGFEQLLNIAGGIDAWSQELDAQVARY